MMRALSSAASGMAAQQFNLDTISNNLANVNTSGFRANIAEFQDQAYQTLQAPGEPIGASNTPSGQQVGLGVKISSSEKLFTQGALTQTGNTLNVGIQGDGFFQITQPDGSIAYTRDGSFVENSNGALVTANGNFLSPSITVPSNAVSVNIGQDGIVAVQLPGATTTQQVGQITLARFTNPDGLIAVGNNLYTQTAASGSPIVSAPGLNGAGMLESGYLENSNVSVITEMVNMITAQRAFEANSKSVSTADQMLSTAVQLKQ
jgi:flagellar basal-body rod protein FlgG